MVKKVKNLGLTYPSRKYVLKNTMTAAAVMVIISSFIFVIDTVSMYLFLII